MNINFFVTFMCLSVIQILQASGGAGPAEKVHGTGAGPQVNAAAANLSAANSVGKKKRSLKFNYQFLRNYTKASRTVILLDKTHNESVTKIVTFSTDEEIKPTKKPVYDETEKKN